MTSFSDRGFRSVAAGAIGTAFVAGWALSVDMTEAAPLLSLLLVPTNTFSPPSGTASFEIIRIDTIENTELVEPAAIWFRAVNFTGFEDWDGNPITNVTDDSNVYDKVQHQVQIFWDYGEPGYTPRFTPNIPTAWRDLNKDEGIQVGHVFRAGSKTITAYAYDTQGNWASAQYVFGDVAAGANAPAIPDADTFFAGNRTTCYSPTGDFTGAPAGATLRNTYSGLKSAISARRSAGDNMHRILFQRGSEIVLNDDDTENDQLPTAGSWGVHFGAYGPGSEYPLVKVLHTRRPTRGLIQFNGNLNPSVIADLDFQGGWDATTETGSENEFFWGAGQNARHIAIYRCRISGFFMIELRRDNVTTLTRNVFDTEVTNWRNYGFFANGTYNGLVGCRIHQHPDALQGIMQPGRQEPTNLGNIHGPWRTPNMSQSHIRATSFFSKNGWSLSNTTNWATAAPTAEQACIRFNTNDGVSNVTHRHNWTCVYFEGGISGCLQLAGNGNAGGDDNGTKNLVIDKAIFASSAQSSQAPGSPYEGVTFRNCYGYLSDIARLGWTAGSLSDWWTWPFSTVQPNCSVYNCTMVNLRSSGEGSLNPFVASGTGSRSLNNAHYRPNSTPAVDQILPVGAGNLDGVVLLHTGQRWNFPPIGAYGGNEPAAIAGPIDVTSVREGGAGPVAVGEWIELDYPDYTGCCRGTNANGPLGQVTRAIAEANSTQFHQLSITDYGKKRMSPAAAGGTGDIVVDFTDTKIRIQNTSGGTWSVGSVWFLMDLSDHLMAPRADTAHAGQSVPLFVPLATSPAFISAYGGPFPRTDLLGNFRPQALNDSQVVVTGQRTAGAFAA